MTFIIERLDGNLWLKMNENHSFPSDPINESFLGLVFVGRTKTCLLMLSMKIKSQKSTDSWPGNGI